MLVNKNTLKERFIFLTCEISDFTPYAHAQSNIQHIKYSEKTDD